MGRMHGHLQSVDDVHITSTYWHPSGHGAYCLCGWGAGGLPTESDAEATGATHETLGNQ